MLREEIIKYGQLAKIVYPDRYNGKVAQIVAVDLNGDATLEFESGKQVRYHVGWLVAVNDSREKIDERMEVTA